MEEKILDFIMEYAQENEGVPFQVIEENFNIVMDDKLKDIISDAIWDRDNVSDVITESERYVIICLKINTGISVTVTVMELRNLI